MKQKIGCPNQSQTANKTDTKPRNWFWIVPLAKQYITLCKVQYSDLAILSCSLTIQAYNGFLYRYQ